ncbi:polysaccharide pyruvyl transferase-domain-containing protein [Scenedesmus sp. NREL 46B-D3]|nr:polysaccharide pyruvyl transferase-domain-containing protein [Scenedesmus sp. NREL 46B-D3]
MVKGVELKRPTRLLATGFYFRGNLGDELYPLILERIFGSANIECRCTDTLVAIPSDTDAILVGGGDVVNPWFMDKVAALIAAFVGPVYLVSAGIPYGKADLRYLLMFDHVFLRTEADCKMARSVLGHGAVTRCRDMAWALMPPPLPPPPPPPRRGRRVALTLAQPYFAKNACAEALKLEVVALVTALAKQSEVVMLLPFNTHRPNHAECDLYINQEVCERAGLPNVVCIEEDQGIASPEAMLELFGRLDLLVAMRLHSVIFAMMQRVPFVCMYTTRKVANLLKDAGAEHRGYKLPVDERSRPTSLDSARVLRMIGELAEQPAPALAPDIDWQLVADMACERKCRPDRVRGRTALLASLDQVVARCRALTTNYTGMSEQQFEAWLMGKACITRIIDEQAVSLLEACRLVCYAATDSTTSPCLWGLRENCQREGFCLRDALAYIHHDHVTKTLEAMRSSSHHCANSASCSRPAPRHVVDLTRQDLHEFAGTHRAGWPYVVKGLLTFDAAAAASASGEAHVVVDTYVDRTFHWGHDALLLEGNIPYARPWMGFVHHTFTTDHGPYNCTALFAKPAFLKSLPSCRCLIAMSQYLADDLRCALDAAGFPRVGVEVLLHPTEPVDGKFSMQRLLSNPRPKLVQVGSWLRSSYALYKMPQPEHSDIRLQKCILKTKESTNYLKPPAVEAALQRMLEESLAVRDKNFPKAYNFYVRELIEHLREEEQSVQLLERLSNDDYDGLLTENVVFLRLIDCSACNTIIETIVRAGVIICNRHPAAAEYLEPNAATDGPYPGFYDTLEEAAAIAGSTQRLAACHAYISRLDTSRLSMHAFLSGFEAILDRHL